MIKVTIVTSKYLYQNTIGFLYPLIKWKKNIKSKKIKFNINYNLKNTKKELLDIISKLKKTEIISMINQFNNTNNVNNINKNENENENMNVTINVKKEKIKIPSNLNKIKFNSRKSNNEYYKNY